ncbi:hypothetical protein EFA46_015210 (plasmid) [Halarchaeum sp. CBA1220]|uniref:TCP-1/cpn60 chaperonin family protein n=1 Tax=Halarchaeum sp. CBA1220 TaxID=1853682 RepID=UPI000F3A9D79|nr:TCP-1/cpn60 chaperonin family protein [Halarchaeum sp. CBA1220]QLC35576.1 hypothetical protein EFA46_015210 [Halarchaeum sp. CBA1220]
MSDSSDSPDAEDLLAEAERYPEADVDTLITEVPRLVELLKRGGFESEDIEIRLNVIDGLLKVAEHNPDALGDQYPEVIENLLDTAESRAIASVLLHDGAELCSKNVAPTSISGGFLQGLDQTISHLGEKFDSEFSDEIPGQGATAIELAAHLRSYADSVSGREQLAVESFADGVEALVEYYALESGVDPIDALVDLRAQRAPSTDVRMGLLPSNGQVGDVVDAGETQSTAAFLRRLSDAVAAAAIIVLVERTRPRILRVEALVSERIR